MTCVRGRLDSGHITYYTSQVDKDASIADSSVRVKVQAAAVRNTNTEMLKFLSSGSGEFSFPACTELSGKVVKVGTAVTRVSVGDIVCGVLSPLSEASACADYCDISELNIVKVPAARSSTEAAACIGPGVRAYTALVYHGAVHTGATVLIMSAASAFGLTAIQLAHSWGAKIITTVCGNEERGFLEKNYPYVAQIIDMGSRNCSLISSVMEETGHLGANIIIDAGVNMVTDETQDAVVGVPSKHDIISCLAVNGRWITSQMNLQLDPPDSMLLQMRNASVHFLFENAWTVSHTQQGRYLHILSELMEKLASGLLKVHVSRTVQFTDADSVLTSLPERQIGSTVMCMN